MNKTYQELAKDNQYLYGQMENCTQLMGWAQLSNQETQYKEFLRLKNDIKRKIDINLQLIEDIWNAPIVTRPAAKVKMTTNFRNECEVIKRLKAEPGLTVAILARRLQIREVVITNIIQKYGLTYGCIHPDE